MLLNVFHIKSVSNQFLLCLSIIALVECVKVTIKDSIERKLHYYEKLGEKDFQIRTRRKRSVDGTERLTKQVSFTSFGREFNLVLSPGVNVLSSDFSARVVYATGRSEPLNVNTNDFYTGHIAEDQSVEVDGHLEDGQWTANIYFEKDTYTLEPSWRHISGLDNVTNIIYRHSDIKWDNIYPHLANSPHKRKTTCKTLHAEDEVDFDPNVEKKLEREAETASEHNREKRATGDLNTCPILAVADTTFFNGPGGGFPHRTANYIIQSMVEVNRIFKKTKWGGGFIDFGFQIKELQVHPEHTEVDTNQGELHYNMPREDWPDEDLLRQFGEEDKLHKFCLAHLFTHRAFAGGVLGLAYIASPRKFALGGICSRGSKRAMNTGFSSTRNTRGGNLLTQEARLVTAHEFGHNWGAEHDADTSECAPGSFNNGKYLMYPYAVSGYEENNDLFSPCSKRFVSAVLATRSRSCFKGYSAKIPLCGNGVIDIDEECDAGTYGLQGLDKCCTPDCMFKGSAKCSSVNFECCTDCQMATAQDGILCRGENKDQCQRAAYCTGTSLHCPQSSWFNDSTACVDSGKCFGGKCLHFCENKGRELGIKLKPCICDTDRDVACKRCCRAEGELCTPYGEDLPNGRPCVYGYCEEGHCKTAKVNMIQRLFNFFDRLDSNTVVEVMRSNIVGTVLILSLIIWVPLSWIFSCVDKRRKRSKDERNNWISNENQRVGGYYMESSGARYKVREAKQNPRSKPEGAPFISEPEVHVPPKLEEHEYWFDHKESVL